MSDQLSKKFTHDKIEYELIPNSTAAIPFILKDNKGNKLYAFDLSNSDEYSICTFGGKPIMRLNKQYLADVMEGKYDKKDELAIYGNVVTVGNPSGWSGNWIPVIP